MGGGRQQGGWKPRLGCPENPQAPGRDDGILPKVTASWRSGPGSRGLASLRRWAGGRGWFKDGSSASRLFCTLFPLLLYQLHLRSSGIRSRKLGTLGLVTDMSLSKSDMALETSKQDLEMEPWNLGMKLEQVTEALC